MSSATEAVMETVHNNNKAAIIIRVALDKMGHKQGSTSLKTDNNIAKGFVNNTIRQKRSKDFNMRFRWMIDRIKQKQFWVY